MAMPKRKTVDCPVRVACDGRTIGPGRDMCAPCRETLDKREKRKKEAPR